MASPIAADGGFGQMVSDESETEEDTTAEIPRQDLKQNETIDDDEEVGEDFDDFEAGATDEDFGDFDEGNKPEPVGPAAPSVQSFPALESPFVSPVALLPTALNVLSCQLLSISHC